MKSKLLMMRIIFSLLCLSLIVTSAIAQQSNIKYYQDRWMHCLRQSFQIQRKQNSDPNWAAEIAFQACATEEERLWAFSREKGVDRAVFLHLKAETKSVLVEGK
jgi:hypothetical protein